MIIPRSREASPQPSAMESLSLPEIRRLAIENIDKLPYHELLRMARGQSSSTKVGSSVVNVFAEKLISYRRRAVRRCGQPSSGNRARLRVPADPQRLPKSVAAEKLLI